MRVLFPDVSNPKAGKGFFLSALAKELPNHGVEVVYRDGAHDLSIHAIRMWCKTKKPRILRLDGVYHDSTTDFDGANAGLKEHALCADGVVCQSEYSRQMVMRYLGVPENKIAKIYNGAKPVKTNAQPDRNVFVAVSKWRPHKRLTDIVESFLIAGIDGATLYVCGDTAQSELPKKSYGANVQFLGRLTHDRLWEMYGKACASIHLCTFDACPNSVVEAIVMKCPVITNNVGGTPEIVGPSGGIVLELDAPYDYGPRDLYHPPAIDRHVVAKAIRQCRENRPVISNEHVLIETAAKEYKRFFERFV